MAEMTDEVRVVALDRLRPGDIADRSGELLDVVFGWADFARLRRQVAAQCATAGLTGTRLDHFVLAVHEIAANAIVHAGAGAGGRLILRRASWTDIGQSMGVTKQAAQKRFVPKASDWGDLLSGAFPPDPVKFSRFTDRARRGVIAARQEAIRRRHDRVLPEHLTLGMLHGQEGLAARAIAALGVSPEAARAAHR